VAVLGASVLATCLHAQPAELRVVGTRPAAHVLDAATDGVIEVRFDRPVQRSSVDPNSFWAFGRCSGPVTGPISFASGDSAIRITPELPLAAGERVMVVLSHDLRGADGALMREAGYSYRYWTRTLPVILEFSEAVQLSTRDQPLLQTRSYGGFAANLNADRLLDLGIVNEETADVRIFLNNGDGGARFDTFLQPPTPVGARASPSETSDFNRDGNMDVCVVNIDDSSVSILLGRGDGTFEPQQTVGVGLTPRGVTVLDADGDGDIDIANTNLGNDDISVLLNGGRGRFQAGLQFDAGGEGEWAIEAEDMDDDGILDLVVGCQRSQTVHVNRGLGEGVFAEVGSSPSGGPVWMLNCGDVDGDGREDVVVVNSHGNSAAVLIGDGQGGLGAPSIHFTDPLPLASDLGDLDGDGDLDWVTSSFDGDWILLTNDGSGAFQFERRFAAPRAASCAIPFDMDDDGDLDLALVDELVDVIFVYENVGRATAVESSEWSRVKGLFRR
jgi:hypothetical protein